MAARRKTAQAEALRVALYVRISSDPGGLEKGVDRQEEDCRALAEALGWRVVRVFRENDTSAYKQKTITLPSGERVRRVIRPMFREMLQLLARRGADAMIAYDLDRAVRDPRDLEDLIDTKVLTGFQVKSTTGSLRLENHADIAMARVLVAMANKSSADTARRVKRASQQQSQAPLTRQTPFLPASGGASLGVMIFAHYLAALSNSYDVVGVALDIDQAPASSSNIARMELLSEKMPALLIEAYRVHDGSGRASIFAKHGFYSSWALMPINRVFDRMLTFPTRALAYAEYDDRAEDRDQRIHSGWFLDGWVPFAENPDGSMLFLDFDPDNDGTQGQVIGYRHDPDEMFFAADSFEHLLKDSKAAFAEDGDEILYDLIPE
jgi:DNA invertase Pin-like site-specific DNA recombinase/cell wall assembly regulator SMI1